MKNFKILFTISIIIPTILFTSCNKDEKTDNSSTETTGVLTDSRDGKIYKWVKIGNQYWMAENLNYDASSGIWIYNNDSNNADTYGRLYNWETACDVCPDGWHLPSDAEFTSLVNYLGGKNVAGGKMKEAGTIHWDSVNEGATNESGFSALPGGYCNMVSNFDELGYGAYFWSSTKGVIQNYAYYRTLYHHNSIVTRYEYGKEYGYSVRCVRD